MFVCSRTPTLISTDEIEAILEIETLCYFTRKKERAKFWAAFFKATGSTSFEDTRLDHFESGYIVAREILYRRAVGFFINKRRNRNSLNL